MKLAETMYGEKIDLDLLEKYSEIEITEDNGVILFDEKENMIAKVPLSTLITCWIEKEQEAYEETKVMLHKPKKKKR